MKKSILVLTFFFLFIAVGKCQIVFTPNTYYVIPPTSVCNGIWAVESPIQVCVLTNYMISPLGCATISGSNGDTLFFDLCSIPCEFIAVNDSGVACMICSIQNLTDVNFTESEGEKFLLYPNPAHDFISIHGKSPYASTLVLLNSLGKEVIREDFTGNLPSDQISVRDLEEGVYYWILSSGIDKLSSGRIAVIR